jgi:hypothetical protein
MSKQQGRREQTLLPHAPQRQSTRTADHPQASVALAHRHGLGHLATHGDLRCGCGPDVLGTENHVADLAAAPGTTGVPRRRQLAGFVLTHFIYSDRM